MWAVHALTTEFLISTGIGGVGYVLNLMGGLLSRMIRDIRSLFMMGKGEGGGDWYVMFRIQIILIWNFNSLCIIH